MSAAWAVDSDKSMGSMGGSILGPSLSFDAIKGKRLKFFVWTSTSPHGVVVAHDFPVAEKEVEI